MYTIPATLSSATGNTGNLVMNSVNYVDYSCLHIMKHAD